MVKLSIVRASNASLVKSQQPLVAVFVGGTSGIGEFTVRELATTCGAENTNLRLYIVGRNESRARATLADCQKLCPHGHFTFVKAEDLSLLRDVDVVCQKLIEAEEAAATAAGDTPRIDFLVMTQAIFRPWDPRNEGLDKFISLLYYSRMRCITQLMPLLLASALPAHIVSVFGPQRDEKWFPEDLSLRSPKKYGFMSSGSHAAYFMTFYMEYLAKQHPGRLSLVHYFPGLVLGDSFDDPGLPRWFIWLFRYGRPIIKYFCVPGNESGQRIINLASSRYPARPETEVLAAAGKKSDLVVSSDGVVDGGAYKVNWNGEIMPTQPQYVKLRQEGWYEKIVEHTSNVFEEIINGSGVFTG